MLQKETVLRRCSIKSRKIQRNLTALTLRTCALEDRWNFVTKVNKWKTPFLKIVYSQVIRLIKQLINGWTSPKQPVTINKLTKQIELIISPPIIITQTENIFSASVFGDTFPKPTLVILLRVKYNAVMYRVERLGVVELLEWLTSLSCLDNSFIQPNSFALST